MILGYRHHHDVAQVGATHAGVAGTGAGQGIAGTVLNDGAPIALAPQLLALDLGQTVAQAGSAHADDNHVERHLTVGQQADTFHLHREGAQSIEGRCEQAVELDLGGTLGQPAELLDYAGAEHVQQVAEEVGEALAGAGLVDLAQQTGSQHQRAEAHCIGVRRPRAIAQRLQAPNRLGKLSFVLGQEHGAKRVACLQNRADHPLDMCRQRPVGGTAVQCVAAVGKLVQRSQCLAHQAVGLQQGFVALVGPVLQHRVQGAFQQGNQMLDLLRQVDSARLSLLGEDRLVQFGLIDLAPELGERAVEHVAQHLCIASVGTVRQQCIEAAQVGGAVARLRRSVAQGEQRVVEHQPDEVGMATQLEGFQYVLSGFQSR